MNDRTKMGNTILCCPLCSRALTTFLTLEAPCLSFCAIFFTNCCSVQYVLVYTGESLFCLASCDSVFSYCCPRSHIVKCILPVLLLYPRCLVSSFHAVPQLPLEANFEFAEITIAAKMLVPHHSSPNMK